MGKTYIITGSTSGIGKALTEEFCKNNIVFAGYRGEAINMDNVIPFYIDLSKPETITPAIEFIKSKTDNVDTLINCAGCVVAGALKHISIEELQRQFNVNTFGALEFSKGFVPKKIINISSMSSFGIYPFIAPYCASKRALDILFNLYSLETGVNVTSLKLGSVATPIWSKSIKENSETIAKATDYKSECEYLIKNALKNETKGMRVNRVVNLVKKVDKMSNPKPSYTLGLDAKFTELVSHLPQGWINFVIKQKLRTLK